MRMRPPRVYQAMPGLQNAFTTRHTIHKPWWGRPTLGWEGPEEPCSEYMCSINNNELGFCLKTACAGAIPFRRELPATTTGRIVSFHDCKIRMHDSAYTFILSVVRTYGSQLQWQLYPNTYDYAPLCFRVILDY